MIDLIFFHFHEFKTKLGSKKWFFFCIIFFLGIFLRWYHLDQRPFHHDESLHALYGKYFYTAADTMYYKFDPMLHGPLLYHLIPFAYDLVGMGKWQARALDAFLGTILMVAPLFFYRFFSARGILFFFTLLALSPSHIYWSRFIKHDMLVLTCAFLTLFFLLNHHKKGFAALGFFFLCLPFCIKANFFIHYVLIFAFLLYRMSFNKIFSRSSDISLKEQFWGFVKNNSYSLAFTFLFCIVTYFYFYTAGWRWWDGLWQNMFTTGITYWLNQHQVERIPGPFIFQTITLAWYDFAFFCFIIVQVSYFYWKQYQQFGKKIFIPWALYLALIFTLQSLFITRPFEYTEFARFFKFKMLLDLYLFIFFIAHAVYSTSYFLWEKKSIMAFTNYFFWSLLFSYSYAGERVPWLAMYPFFAGLVFLTHYFDHYKLWNKYYRPAMIVVTLFTLRIAIKVNFSQAGAANQLISQVHTTDILEKTCMHILRQNENPLLPEKSILSLGDTNWPLSWYFFGKNYYSFNRGAKEYSDFDYIFANLYDQNLEQKLEGKYNKIVLPFRVWWVPDYTKLTFYNFFHYAFSHNPWNDTGYMDVALYTKK